MKKMIALLGLGIALAVSAPAFAGAQQSKMKECNADAKTQALKGAERKAFMKQCLKKDGASTPDAAAKAAKKEKKQACKSEAKTKALKGQERKDFMKSCMSA